MRGKYFARKLYQPSALPTYASVKDRLPSPVFDEEPLLVESYWKAWQLAFLHFYEPPPHSRLVSQPLVRYYRALQN